MYNLAMSYSTSEESAHLVTNRSCTTHLQVDEEPPIRSLQVAVASLSTRGTGAGHNAQNPIKVKEDSGDWPPSQEAAEFLHLHRNTQEKNLPDLFQVYGADLNFIDPTQPDPSLNIDDLTPNPTRTDGTKSGASGTSPRYGTDFLSTKIRKRYEQQAAIAAADNRFSDQQIERIRRYGMNAFSNVNTDDEEEAYLDPAYGPVPVFGPKPGQRKDLLWITIGSTADARIKLAMIALANRYTGHGTSMAELKSIAHYPTTTPCDIDLTNDLCNCFLQTDRQRQTWEEEEATLGPYVSATLVSA